MAIVIYTLTQLSNVTVEILNVIESPSTSNITSISELSNLGNLTKAFVPVENSCALGATSETIILGVSYNTTSIASSNCQLLEILGGCTIGLGLVIAILQCYTCYLCGFGGVLDFVFAAAGSIAWAVAAVIINQKYINIKNSGNDPSNNGKREAVMIMCWAVFGFFVLLLLATFLKCCSSRFSTGDGGGKSYA